MRNTILLATAAIALGGLARPADADMLSNVKEAGVLRCGVMLDFPPAGFRNAQNEADGFDVDFCKAVAAKLGVKAEVVETPSPDRIPALISGRVDVSVAGASITPERARTIDFTRPYSQYPFVVVVKDGTNIKSFDDLKSHTIGGVRGSAPELMLRKYAGSQWDGSINYVSYNSDAEQNLALAQGRIDGFVTVVTAAAVLKDVPQFKDFVICCNAPFENDVVGMMTRKGDPAFLEELNSIIGASFQSGAYADLYRKWFAIDAPTPPESAEAVLAGAK